MGARQPPEIDAEADAEADALLRFERYFSERIAQGRREMRGFELRAADIRVLGVLAELPFAPTAAWLRSRLGIDRGYLSRVLRVLEHGGLIRHEIEVEPGARSRGISLTSLGATLHRQIRDYEQSRARQLLRELPDSQRARLLEALETVEEILKRDPTRNWLEQLMERASPARPTSSGPSRTGAATRDGGGMP